MRRTAIVVLTIVALSCAALWVTQAEQCKVKNQLRHCVD